MSHIQEILRNAWTKEEIMAITNQEQYKWKVRESPFFWCFTYDMIASDMTLPECQEARGIILSKKDHSVIARGFDKFFNYGESLKVAQSMKHLSECKNVAIYEKVDGSLIKLYFNPFSVEWCFATNNMIDSKNASVNGSEFSFFDLVQECLPSRVCDWKINKDYTYLFEMQHPLSQVIVPVSEPKIIILGARRNVDGFEVCFHCPLEQQIINDLVESSGIPAVNFQLIDSFTLKDEYLYAFQKNKQLTEGIVIAGRDEKTQSIFRVKWKTPEYLAGHHMNYSALSPTSVLDVCRREICDDHRGKPIFDKMHNVIHETVSRTVGILDSHPEFLALKKSGSRKEFFIGIKNISSNTEFVPLFERLYLTQLKNPEYSAKDLLRDYSSLEKLANILGINQ